MELGLTRRNIGRLALLAWAVALAWLARREFSGGGAAATVERVRRLEPGAQFFAVMAGDRQIGQLNRSVDTLVDGVRLTELLVLDIPDGDSTRQLARSLEIELTRGLRLRRFTRTVFGLGPAERLEGGLGPDSLLTLRNFEANAPAGPPVPLGAGTDPVLPAMLPLRIALGGGEPLRVGRRTELPVLDLGTGQVRPVAVAVAAESTFVVADSAVWSPGEGRWLPASLDTVRGYRLDHRAPGPATATWVDADGGLLAEAIQGGYTLRRSAFEIVSTNYRRGRRAESAGWRRGVAGMVGLAASGRTPDWTGKLPAGRLRSGRADSGRYDPNPLDPPDSTRDLPDRWRGPAWDLAPLDDSLLQETARRALGGASTARDSVRALTGWVGNRVRTDLSPTGFGTALNTLRTGQGAPDGKVRLFAALARAAGIPARVVRGLALRPEGAYAHAWAEVWIGQWVAVDPVFGQFPAAGSLLRVGIGERSRPTDLVPLLASAQFLPLRVAR
jgi:hypothetical protein